MAGSVVARLLVSRTALRAGALWAVGYLVFTGVLTVLVPNSLFIRMTPIVWVDYLLWPVSAIMIGGFMALRADLRARPTACTTTAGAGGLAAFLGFSCPVCNKVLLVLLGTGGVLTFIEPYRTWIGLAGILLLGAALAWMWRIHRRAGDAEQPTDAAPRPVGPTMPPTDGSQD